MSKVEGDDDERTLGASPRSYCENPAGFEGGWVEVMRFFRHKSVIRIVNRVVAVESDCYDEVGLDTRSNECRAKMVIYRCRGLRSRANDGGGPGIYIHI